MVYSAITKVLPNSLIIADILYLLAPHYSLSFIYLPIILYSVKPHPRPPLFDLKILNVCALGQHNFSRLRHLAWTQTKANTKCIFRKSFEIKKAGLNMLKLGI